LGAVPKFTPLAGQPGVCNLSVPVDSSILERINVDGANPGKTNIVTKATGSKFTAHDFYGALHSAPPRAVITAVPAKT
jgi:hypothetical protein